MRELRWKHRSWFSRSFDLVEGERVLATLAQRGWSGMDADLTMGDRKLKLETTGTFRWTMRVVDEQGIPLASMRIGWRGNGTPTLADGRAFAWDTETWWGSRWALDQKGAGRIAMVHMDRFLRMDARLEVDPGTLRDDELIPLLALTWLSVVLMAQAATTAGAG